MAGGASAQEQTVGQMIPHCERAASLVYRSEEELSHGAYCFGVIAGVRQVMAYNCLTVSAGTASPHPSFTGNPNLGNGPSAQLFVNWARAHPEQWGEPFPNGVISAFAEAFPCRAGQ